MAKSIKEMQEEFLKNNKVTKIEETKDTRPDEYKYRSKSHIDADNINKSLEAKYDGLIMFNKKGEQITFEFLKRVAGINNGNKKLSNSYKTYYNAIKVNKSGQIVARQTSENQITTNIKEKKLLNVSPIDIEKEVINPNSTNSKQTKNPAQSPTSNKSLKELKNVLNKKTENTKSLSREQIASMNSIDTQLIQAKQKLNDLISKEKKLNDFLSKEKTHLIYITNNFKLFDDYKSRDKSMLETLEADISLLESTQKRLRIKESKCLKLEMQISKKDWNDLTNTLSKNKTKIEKMHRNIKILNNNIKRKNPDSTESKEDKTKTENSIDKLSNELKIVIESQKLISLNIDKLKLDKILIEKDKMKEFNKEELEYIELKREKEELKKKNEETKEISYYLNLNIDKLKKSISYSSNKKEEEIELVNTEIELLNIKSRAKIIDGLVEQNRQAFEAIKTKIKEKGVLIRDLDSRIKEVKMREKIQSKIKSLKINQRISK